MSVKDHEWGKPENPEWGMLDVDSRLPVGRVGFLVKMYHHIDSYISHTTCRYNEHGTSKNSNKANGRERERGEPSFATNTACELTLFMQVLSILRCNSFVQVSL